MYIPDNYDAWEQYDRDQYELTQRNTRSRRLHYLNSLEENYENEMEEDEDEFI